MKCNCFRFSGIKEWGYASNFWFSDIMKLLKPQTHFQCRLLNPKSENTEMLVKRRTGNLPLVVSS